MIAEGREKQEEGTGARDDEAKHADEDVSRQAKKGNRKERSELSSGAARH